MAEQAAKLMAGGGKGPLKKKAPLIHKEKYNLSLFLANFALENNLILQIISKIRIKNTTKVKVVINRNYCNSINIPINKSKSTEEAPLLFRN